MRSPDGQRYPVRFADLWHPPITLVEHRRAQALLRERGRSLEDERLIFQVIEEQRALVDAAAVETREARRAAERRDRALDGARRYAVEEMDPESKENIGVFVNEHSKLTRFQHLILTRLWSDKAPRRAALI